jgi:hypothetical protein
MVLELDLLDRAAPDAALAGLDRPAVLRQTSRTDMAPNSRVKTREAQSAPSVQYMRIVRACDADRAASLCGYIAGSVAGRRRGSRGTT